MSGKRGGKGSKADPALQAELEARHVEVERELAAEREAIEGALGFTRRAFVYWMGSAYDMLTDEVADGFRGDRQAHVDRLLAHMQANFGGLLGFPVEPGSVLDSEGFDEDDPENPDV